MPFKGTFGKIFLKGHPTFYGSKPTMEVTARSDEYSPKFPKFPNIPKCKLRISPIDPPDWFPVRVAQNIIGIYLCHVRAVSVRLFRKSTRRLPTWRRERPHFASFVTANARVPAHVHPSNLDA